VGRLAAVFAWWLALWGGCPVWAQFSLVADGDSPSSDRERDELYRLVKRFDFDERKFDNYEDAPMHWRKLGGPGLPAYSRGKFDERVGHTAPPSFQLSVETGNVAYEYDHLDLTVVPESDYLVAGQIRPNGLRQTGAFIAAYLVDRYGERIFGSERVSRLVRSTESADEPWQAVEVLVPGAFPHAYALRIQVWILQDSVWRATEAGAVDPIVRNDVRCGAWFDDVAVYRLPRARMAFSHPAGLVLPGRHEALLLDVHNATAQTLEAEVHVFDDAGNVVHRTELVIPSADRAPPRVLSATSDRSERPTSVSVEPEHPSAVRTPLPDLPPGLYGASLRVLSNGESLLERRLRFAVVPPLPAAPGGRTDIGLDIGLWRGGDANGIVQAASELGAAVVRIGVPLTGQDAPEGAHDRLNEISAIVRELAKRRVETIGVLTLENEAGIRPGPTAIRELLLQSDALDRISPTFAYFGGLMQTWQAGDETIELAALGEWTQKMLTTVRDQLRRFITSPELVAPVSALATSAPSGFTRSVWVPTSIATRDMPRQLEPFVTESGRTYVRLQSDSATYSASPEIRARNWANLARRFAMAKGLGGDRLFIDAPLRRIAGGAVGFEPTDDFPVVRTLMRFLSGKRLVATLRPGPDVIGMVFGSADESVMVIWSWREDGQSTPVEMYLGRAPKIFDLSGTPFEPKSFGGRTLIEVTSTPLIVVGLRSSHALLQASFHVSPRNIQQHSSDSRPTLRFRNPYTESLRGEMLVTPPVDWQITPSTFPVELAPGEVLEHPLAFSLPPRQVAAEHSFRIKLHVQAPEDAVLEFEEQLTVGLNDIEMSAAPHWQGDSLVVEQTLRNKSDKPVSFSGFCAAPGRPRAEAVFAGVKANASVTQTYVFDNAREMAGGHLHLGIQEVRGQRRLNQLVEIPPK
jgi:hypothetical protein